MDAKATLFSLRQAVKPRADVVVLNGAAMDDLKVIAGFGHPLAGTLLYYEARDIQFHRMPIARRPDCAVYGGSG